MSQTLTLSYDATQDRILVAVNAAQQDHWSCWLTRRLALAVLAQTPAYLSQTSELAQKTPVDYRRDLIQFEREAALAQTAESMSRLDDKLVRDGADHAELAEVVNLHTVTGGLVLELRGMAGGHVTIPMQRPQLQRVLQMLTDECVRAGWIATATAPPPSNEPPAAKPPVN